MDVTVEEALKIKPFDQLTVLAGKNGLHRVIRYVDSSETPDNYLWLRKDEFIITTGYSIKDNLEAQLSLLKALAEVGGAGMAVKFGRFIGSIPEEMLQLANSLSMPLLGVPNDLPFIDLTHPLMQHILNKQAKRLAYSEKVYSILTKISLESNSLAALSSGLCDMIGHEVYIYSNRIQLQSVLGVEGNQVFPVQIKEQVYGYLVIKTAADLDEMQLIAISHTQTLAALLMVNKALRLESNRKEQRDFLEDLLAGRMCRCDVIVNRAKDIGFSIEDEKYLLVFDLDYFSEYLLQYHIVEDYAADVKKNFFHVVQNALMKPAYINYSLVVQQSDRIIAILPTRFFPYDLVESLARENNIFAEIRRNIMMIDDRITVSIGISDKIGDMLMYPEKYDQIDRMLTLARRLNGGSQNVLWEDAQLYLLLEDAKEPLKRFYWRLMERFKEHNIKNGDELLETLYVYLKCRENGIAAAEQLFIHRNTLRYRLEHLEEALGAEIHTPDMNLMLRLMLRARKILN